MPCTKKAKIGILRKWKLLIIGWRASTFEKYFYYDACFDKTAYGFEEGDIVDNRRFNGGNYFKTKEEAEEYRQYCLNYKNEL